MLHSVVCEYACAFCLPQCWWFTYGGGGYVLVLRFSFPVQPVPTVWISVPRSTVCPSPPSTVSAAQGGNTHGFTSGHANAVRLLTPFLSSRSLSVGIRICKRMVMNFHVFRVHLMFCVCVFAQGGGGL